MNALKIRYIKDDEGIIYGAVAVNPIAGYKVEYIAPAHGGLWVDGKQVIGHADYYLTGTNDNRRRQLRRYIVEDDRYYQWMEMQDYISNI